jgi:membrane-associated phospholipid phosphatase
MACVCPRILWLSVVILVAFDSMSGRAEPDAAGLNPSLPIAPTSTEQGAPALRLSWLGDSAAALAAGTGIALSTLVSVDQSSRWHTQMLPFDDRLKGRYSPGAAELSNILLTADVVAPGALFLGSGLNRATGARMVVYAETILVQFALDAMVKPWVGRPRPYVYSDDPTVVAYAQGKGRDSHFSFYSVHASTSFSASVAGAYLYAQSTSDTNARAAVWGVELALAAATSDLRTRAGQHFYSDVLVGASIGSTLGVLIPYLHGGRKVHLSKLEWLAIALGPLVGIAAGELLPTGS